MILALKAALILSVAGLVVFTADYTRLTRWAAWRDPVGQTIIIAELLLLCALVPLLIAAFLPLSAFWNEVGSWILIVSFGAGGLVMFWRTWVFERIHRRSRKGAGQ